MKGVITLFVVVSLFCSTTQGYNTFMKLKKIQQQEKTSGATTPPLCPIPFYNPPLNPSDLPSSVSNTLNLVNKTIQSILNNNNLTAAAYVTIVSGGNTIFSQGYNSISETDKTPPTDKTLFRIGSVSKVFTTLELLHQYEKGNVALDVDITQYAPQFKVTKPANDPNAKVTFNSIASQISGLPRECPCFFYGCNFDNNQIFERYEGTPLLWLPERLPSYSNFGFALIGNILGGIFPLNETNYINNCLEHGGPETCHFVSGVHEDILTPLGMTSTGYFYNVDVEGVVAQGYSNTEPLANKVALGSTGWLSPAASMFSTHSDLAKFLSYILTHLDHEAPDSLPLSSSALREWMVPHFINNDQATGFGRPWEIFYVESESIKGVGFWANTKAGDIPGYAADLVLVNDLNLGIMVTIAAEPPANISPEIAGIITSKMVDSLANYYYFSQSHLPPLPSNYSEYIGKYIVDPRHLSEEQKFMFELLVEKKITDHAQLPSIKISYGNEHSLFFEINAGGTTKLSLFRSNVINGDEDYWQLLLPNINSESKTYPFYPSNCLSMEGGYEGVHVVFKINKNNQVISLSIPTEFYGVSFLKVKV